MSIPQSCRIDLVVFEADISFKGGMRTKLPLTPGVP